MEGEISLAHKIQRDRQQYLTTLVANAEQKMIDLRVDADADTESD